MPKGSKTARRRKTQGGMKDDDNNIDMDVLSESYTIVSDPSCSSTIADAFDESSFWGEVTYEGTTTNSASANEQGENNYESITATSTNNTMSIHDTNHAQLLEHIQIATELCSEKQAKKREQGLKSLFKAITHMALGEGGQSILSSKVQDTILPICTNGLRPGIASPAEQYASCRVLEATSIILGGNQDDYASDLYELLSKVVKGVQRATMVRGAALRALAMGYFICATVDVADDVLDLCQQVCAPTFRYQDVPPVLRATALDCWALLSTTISDAYLAGEGEGRGLIILPLLLDCLNHTNLDLRCAAGEAVALIHEARLDLGIDEDEGENASERRFRRGSWDGTEWEVIMDEVKQRVAELSVESGKHMSKKDKKDQRKTFREFTTTIVDDESPCEVIAFRGGQLTLESWREIIQLNFIRHCLQSGFQAQLMTNPTLHSIFNMDGNTLNELTNMSQLEKRLVMSKTSDASKQKYNQRNKHRKAKIHSKTSFLHDADE